MRPDSRARGAGWRGPAAGWAALAAVSLLVGLVALSSGGGDWPVRPPSRLLVDVPRGLVMLSVVTACASMIAFFAFLLALARHHGKDREVRSALRALLLLPVVALAVALALRNTPLEQIFLNLHPPEGLPGFDDVLGADARATALPFVGVALGLAVLLGALGSLALVVWLALGDRLKEWLGARPAAGADPLAGAVEESLDDLRLEPDVRRAILRCYRRFELVLARSHVPRRPWQTATEFMAEALGRLPLPPDAVRQLTRLFEIARFSSEPLGAADRDAAWEALERIRSSLEQAAQPGTPASGEESRVLAP